YLQDIWRYFRYTWSIPQTSIPGRKLLYLVRDAADRNHAVIGIAALSNCAVQVVPRDALIGWSTRGLRRALKALLAPSSERILQERSDPLLEIQGIYRWLRSKLPSHGEPTADQTTEILRCIHEWLLRSVREGVGEVEQRGLVTPEEVADPTEAV